MESGGARLQQERMRNITPERLGGFQASFAISCDSLNFPPAPYPPPSTLPPGITRRLGGSCRHAVEIRNPSTSEPQAFNIPNTAKNKPLFLPLPLILEAPRQHPKIAKYGPWTQIPETLCVCLPRPWVVWNGMVGTGKGKTEAMPAGGQRNSLGFLTG